MAASAQRPSLNRPKVIKKLTSTALIGRVVALQGILRIIGKMSLAMQTMNSIPRGLMREQRELYDKIVLMEPDLRDRPKETDPRWSVVPLDPFPASVFPLFHEEPYPKNHLGLSRVQMIFAGTYMGQGLTVLDEECAEGSN